MIRKFKNILSLILVLVFVIPMTTKLLDGFLHHHDSLHCTAKNEVHLHQYHGKCSVLNYMLSSFSVEKLRLAVQKYFFWSEINYTCYFIYDYSTSKYSFLLRAPPIL